VKEEAKAYSCIETRGEIIRVKKSTYTHLDEQESVTLNQLASHPGISVFLRGVNITKTGHKFPFNVAAHYPGASPWCE
jgi:hypothetical protein